MSLPRKTEEEIWKFTVKDLKQIFSEYEIYWPSGKLKEYYVQLYMDNMKKPTKKSSKKVTKVSKIAKKHIKSNGINIID